MCVETHASLSLPLSAAIDLHEIHLAPQPSLQVPVGHITVPGGIKLCSPGTFLVANYLIINNGSCQVNFTKPISATIRCTNSQWLRDAATEASVGKVAVPNPVVNPTLIPSTVPISFPSPRRDATEMVVGGGGRAEDRPKINLMPVEDRLWDGSWWRKRDPSGAEPRPCLAARPCLQQKKDDLSSHPCGAENET